MKLSLLAGFTILLNTLLLSQQFGHLRFVPSNPPTQQIVTTYNSSDPNRVYWSEYTKIYGLMMQEFNTDNFAYPSELWFEEEEVKMQATNCINQWHQGGCLNLIQSNNFPACPMQFSDDFLIFSSSSEKGFTAFAVEQYPPPYYQLLMYNGWSESYFEQSQILLNASPFRDFTWSTTLQQPPNPAITVPVKPIILHEMGHLIGLGHHNVVVQNPTVMAYPSWVNPYVFSLTDYDKDHRIEICNINGTPVGVEDHIYIESGPSTFSPTNQVTYTARFEDFPPPSYMINWDWEINLLHADGNYNYISGSTTGLNYTEWSFTAPYVPAGYCWYRDENNNVQAIVKVSGYDSDDVYHEAIKYVGVLNIPGSTTSGTLVNNESWCGNITITGNITVPEGITLTIYPGANIKFDNSASLIVYGKLDAVGLSFSKITFDRSGTSGSWGSITFDGNSIPVDDGPNVSNSILNNVIIKNGTGVRYLNNANGTIKNSLIENCNYGIYIYNSQPKILNNTIYNAVQNAIYGEAPGKKPLIQGNKISRTNGNSYQGVFLLNYTSPFITFNDISGFYHGIYLGGGVNSVFSDAGYNTPAMNNRFINNVFGMMIGWGTYVIAGKSMIEEHILFLGNNNSIFNNTTKDVYVYQSSTVWAQKNYWGGSGPNQYVDGTSYLSSTPYLTSNPWSGYRLSDDKETSIENEENPLGFGPDSILVGILLERNGRFQDAKNHYMKMIGRNSHPELL